MKSLVSSCELNIVPTCVLNLKIIKTLGFGFTWNIHKDKKSETFKLGVGWV